MARCVLGPIVSAIAGSIGAVTFSRSHSGVTARAKSRPTRRDTDKQVERRSNFVTGYISWGELSDGLRSDWAAFAAAPPETDYDSLGNLYLLSGYAWYQRVQQRRAATGDGLQTAVPIGARPLTSPTLDLSLSMPPYYAVMASLDPAGQVTGDKLLLYAWPLHSTVGDGGLHQWTYVGQAGMDGSPQYYYDAAWDGVFGDPALGGSYAWRLVVQNDQGLRGVGRDGVSVFG